MSSAQSQAAFAAPQEYCDIVMKGGITSGVVYPHAICEIAKHYRFHQIGGTSAGAMAAAAAAAAEYGRRSPAGGFARLSSVPKEVGKDLLSLFHPSPRVAPLFNMFVGVLRGRGPVTRTLLALAAALKGYWPTTLLGGALGFLIAAGIALLTGASQTALMVFGVCFALASALAAIILRVYVALSKELPKEDYGLCTGQSAPNSKEPAFTDWLAGLIDDLAGRGKGADPLTFGDLKTTAERPVDLRMMTTSLMERRPYTLPLERKPETPDFSFERSEWARIFPKKVMDYLISHCDRVTNVTASTELSENHVPEFYRFPDPDHLPIVVAARMSLSFPLLVTAVPLWRSDDSASKEGQNAKLHRCLFSDGGLSSNFPIHFFDGLLPQKPTFAISLEEVNEQSDGFPWMSNLDEKLPRLPVQPFEGLLGFLLRIVDSAKDWQDNLQSLLPGYRERIVYLGLKPNEGGLNVTMSPGVIADLGQRGAKAGEMLVAQFDGSNARRWNEHRWRRYLVAQARLEETLADMADRLSKKGAGSWDDFLSPTGYGARPDFYKQDGGLFEVLRDRGSKLSALCGKWTDVPSLKAQGDVPKPDTNLRITAKP